jgi:two-component system cell cycle response regulator
MQKIEKILLVEDSKSQANFANEFLKKAGYETIWAEDGKSAIKAAISGNIDVILLDVNLPDMNGNEVCRILKNREDTKLIPIIMLTVKGTVNDKVAGFQSGADDYLPKPYNENELNARIYACLRTKQLQDELKKNNIELENALKKLEILSITDQLTGLYNRRHFENTLKQEIAKTIRYSTPLSCLMVDIDHFKEINDTYGHNVGDAVLKETAYMIKTKLRDIDTIARWGGDEFILLFPQTKKEEALIPSERILKNISEHIFSGLEDMQVTLSIGISSIPDPDHKNIDSAEKLIHLSDSALYEAKKNGRNRVAII